MEYKRGDDWTLLKQEYSDEAIRENASEELRKEVLEVPFPDSEEREWSVVRDRCFLALRLKIRDKEESYAIGFAPATEMRELVRGIIHLPDLRGNPSRTYPVSAVGASFAGTFEQHTASVISHWQEEDRRDLLDELGDDLQSLGLTWQVKAKHVTDTQVKLQVARLATRGGAKDLVDIADVGLGVSQTLPVLVALLTASEGQLVYLEAAGNTPAPRCAV